MQGQFEGGIHDRWSERAPDQYIAERLAELRRTALDVADFSVGHYASAKVVGGWACSLAYVARSRCIAITVVDANRRKAWDKLFDILMTGEMDLQQ